MDSEAAIRLGIFLGLFGLMALWEVLAPRRRAPDARRNRWGHNLGVQVVNALVLRVVFPGAAVGIAAFWAAHDVGLFQVVTVPAWVSIPLCVIALDLAIYGQHVATHKVPLLWRLHRMHHSDVEIDVTTALRFHPVEIVLSMLWKAVVIALLGAPVMAVLIFEILLNGTAMFNHANVRLPAWLDRVIRSVVVTPDMHRVHHSVHRDETDSNFGFNLAVWDRLFRTYRPQPRDGHTTMTLGLPEFRDRRAGRLDQLLIQPWR